MEKIFLSYTFNPHPDYIHETEELVKNIKIIAECQELQVITGEDLGGNRLRAEIQHRIRDCDATVALISPWKDSYGHPASPPYVNDEFTYALSKDKAAIRLIHSVLKNQGMYTDQEYIPFVPDQPVEALLKLMRTLVLWKKILGRAHEIQLLPPELVKRFENTDTYCCCEYQLLINRKPGQWNKTDIWPEVGGMVTFIPNVPDEAKLSLKVKLNNNEEWHSRFCNLHRHSIKLEKSS